MDTSRKPYPDKDGSDHQRERLADEINGYWAMI